MDSLAIGQIIDLEISGFSQDGAGIGRHQGQVVFVPQALPQETVRVRVCSLRKNYVLAEIVEILSPSPHRIPASCPIYNNCGGCQLQHIAYEEQLRLKEQMVTATLQRIGGVTCKVEPIIGAKTPCHYRNRAQFHIKISQGQCRIGFFARGSHDLTEAEGCLLLKPELNMLYKSAKKNLPAFAAQMEGLHRLVLKCNHDGSALAAIFIADRELAVLPELAEILHKECPSLGSVMENIQKEDSPVLFGKKWRLLWGKTYLPERIQGLNFVVDAGSFTQVNHAQMEILYRKVLAYSAPGREETLIDLYCGTGTISLLLAQKAARVIGVEEFAPAVKDARNNAALNRIANAEFIAGRAEEELPRLLRSGIRPQTIVLDPPRQGCKPEVLEAAFAMDSAKIVYVSCDPATLARDLRICAAGGYLPTIIQPVDMFPHTEHVETVCLLTSKIKAFE